MAHMKPEYHEGQMYQVDTDLGSQLFPIDLVRTHPSLLEFLPYCDGEPLEFFMVEGHFSRLSAPGYLDATDWHGPFSTGGDAREDILSQYDVDPDTGEDALLGW